MKQQPLTIRSLMEALGVSHMTVLAWSRGIQSLNNDPMPRTPGALKRWATKHGVTLLKDPVRLAERPAATTTAKSPKLKRMASGKLTSVRPTASSRASEKRR